MTVTFEVQVYKGSAAFYIPKKVQTQLGVDHGDSIHLIIRTPAGQELFSGRKTLRSGAEIYGSDLKKVLTPGSYILVDASTDYRSPSEEAADDLSEGNRTSISVNRFERNRKARQKCIEIFGAVCQICGFDFGKRYGKIGLGFIHVHHIIPISNIGKNYTIDPGKDLRPVCPNCHEMLHRQKPPFSIEELRTNLH